MADNSIKTTGIVKESDSKEHTEAFEQYLWENGAVSGNSYKKVVSACAKWLKKKGITDSGLDAWYLLDYITKMSRTEYLLRSYENFSGEEYERYIELIQKRGERIPLQHLTGEQEFMGLLFSVSDKVMIPRQDTENLVEMVLPYVKDKRVLDMCTGSGCIAISLASLGGTAECVAADLSLEALEIAKENAVRNKIEVSFVHSDLFSSIRGTYDVIVSNPPYIKPDVIKTLEKEVRSYEPRMALDGGEDGLDFYRRISKEAVRYLNKDGWLFYEIGHDQKEAVMSIMEKEGFCNVSAKKDYSGNDRIVYGQYAR